MKVLLIFFAVLQLVVIALRGAGKLPTATLLLQNGRFVGAYSLDWLVLAAPAIAFVIVVVIWFCLAILAGAGVEDGRE